MNTASVLAVCRVHQLLPDPLGSVGVTAIDKRPIEGPVKVHKLGIHGDVQASRLHHGGEDQAIYAYSQEDADYWSGELQRDLPAGIFGENLRVSGIETTGAVIGERWKVGLDVELEVTSPRTPCATFQRVLGEPTWVKRFSEAGRVGTYLRVVKTMYFEEPDSDAPLPVGPGEARALLAVNGAAVLLFGLLPGGLMAVCADAIRLALAS